jgi:tripartite-type tricarboxylate transporter receptor subunit TctC
MKVVVRSEAGGGYDVLSRLFARHMGRHIPGHPNLITVNMPGGGGILAANYLATVAPRDGTILSIVGQGLVADQALGLSPQLKVDLREFIWIANIESSNQILVVWHTSPTKTIADAKRRETTIGASGAGEGSGSVRYPAFYNHVLGTRFKIIHGYAGGPQINLAMERGEVEGRGTNTYASYLASTPHYFRDNLVVPLIQIGLRIDPALPYVPLLLDQAVSSEDRPLVEFLSKASTVGRPLATTPGVPADRVAALRKAFADTIKDPEFIADAKKMTAEINPTSGEEMQELVRSLLSTPADVRRRVAIAIKPEDKDLGRK